MFIDEASERLTGQRAARIGQWIVDLYDQSYRKLATPDINKVLKESIERQPPRGKRGRPVGWRNTTAEEDIAILHKFNDIHQKGH